MSEASFFTEDQAVYRASVRAYLKCEVLPFYDTWLAQRLVDRDAWKVAARNGIVGLAVPHHLGGPEETDYRYRMVVIEEMARAGLTSFAVGIGVHDDLVLPYLLDLATEEQMRRWLPGMAAGELIGALAMAEPGAAGSGVEAIRTTATKQGGNWILNGQKRFVSSGTLADVVLVIARTDDHVGTPSLSLFVVERDFAGFRRGPKLNTIGLEAHDVCDLSFENVDVPAANLLGEVGEGFGYLLDGLPRERISIAVAAVAGAAAALDWTLTYVHDNSAPGWAGDCQLSRYELATLETSIDITRAYVEQCVQKLNLGTLTPVEAAKAKWSATELLQSTTTQCQQLFDGHGYLNEHPIARTFKDARIQALHGGTTETMKEVIGRDQAARYRC